jgi:hypothetical protein
MMAPPLDFGAAAVVGEAYRKLTRAVDDAVTALTLEVASGATDVAKADLRDMIDGRKGRRLPTDVAAVIARRIGPGRYQDAIFAALREMFGAVDASPEPDALYIDRLENALREYGARGRETLAQCRREARRGSSSIAEPTTEPDRG